MILPDLLKSGDLVGIIAPSSPLLPEQEAQFQQGLQVLIGFGLKPVEGDFIRANSLGYCAHPQEKANDIHRFFADPDIKALIAVQGGSSCNAVLPYLNWQLIRENPKILVGISDITILLAAINQMTGLVTFHGNDVLYGFGNAPTAYDLAEFENRLMHGKTGKIKKNGKRTTICGGQATGRLLGGNAHTLLRLAGTPYFPDFTDAIMFLETFMITPEISDMLLRQFDQIGVFKKIKGMIIGYNFGLDNDDKYPKKMEDILQDILPESSFPILKADDFGHNCPNTTLPVGANIALDADAQEIIIMEKFTKTGKDE